MACHLTRFEAGGNFAPPSRRGPQYMRMTVKNFDTILGLVEPHSWRQDTLMWLAIEPGLKLVVTLHHLAEGGNLPEQWTWSLPLFMYCGT